MKVRVSEAVGKPLDWAVARCVGIEWEQGDLDAGEYGPGFKPSTVWADGGPIIERECVTVRPVFIAERLEGGSDHYRPDGWAAHITPKAYWVTPRPFAGPTPLIAAMRCFVASKLGDEVDVPEELLK